MPKPASDVWIHRYKKHAHAEYNRELLQGLLTRSELRMVARRWYIACLLAQGKSMREIANEVGVGTDTVARMAKRLQAGNSALLKAVRTSIRPKKSVPTANRWVFGASI